MTTPESDEKKLQRRRFADAAAARIATKMHDSLRRGVAVTPDQWREWWHDEAKAAKKAGLYSQKTYYYDAANGLKSLSYQRGWVREGTAQ